VCRRPAGGRWTQIDRPVFLDGDEGLADPEDDRLDMVEQLVGVLSGRDLDLDLADGTRLDAVLGQLREEAVTVRDPRRFDLNRLGHGPPCLLSPGRRNNGRALPDCGSIGTHSARIG
jgi:hypothetical protein